jgi:hypothetical protein
MSAQNPWRNNCFWKGLHTKVPGLSDVASTPQQIVKFLQKHNVLTRNVTWQGQPLDAKLMMQNFIQPSKRFRSFFIQSPEKWKHRMLCCGWCLDPGIFHWPGCTRPELVRQNVPMKLMNVRWSFRTGSGHGGD